MELGAFRERRTAAMAAKHATGPSRAAVKPAKLAVSARRGTGGHRERFQSARVHGGLNKFGKVLQDKVKSDWARVFEGTEKTRKKLGVVDELLSYWKLDDSEEVSLA